KFQVLTSRNSKLQFPRKVSAPFLKISDWDFLGAWLLLFVKSRLPATFTLFPYTTLFRSSACRRSSRPRSSARSRPPIAAPPSWRDRKSTRLNSSHDQISYAVFCLKKKSCCANSSAAGFSLIAGTFGRSAEKAQETMHRKT